MLIEWLRVFRCLMDYSLIYILIIAAFTSDKCYAAICTDGGVTVATLTQRKVELGTKQNGFKVTCDYTINSGYDLSLWRFQTTTGDFVLTYIPSSGVGAGANYTTRGLEFVDNRTVDFPDYIQSDVTKQNFTCSLALNSYTVTCTDDREQNIFALPDVTVVSTPDLAHPVSPNTNVKLDITGANYLCAVTPTFSLQIGSKIIPLNVSPVTNLDGFKTFTASASFVVTKTEPVTASMVCDGDNETIPVPIQITLGCLCEVGNIIFIVLLLICLVSKLGSDIYFLTHNYFPKKKYRNPSDHKVGFALETTIRWTEEHSPQHSAYKENKMKIENEIKGLCGNRITIQNLYFENIKKHLRISFHLMEEDVIFSTFSKKFTNERILGKEIKKVTERNYHIHARRFEGVHLFKNGDILVNESESTACKVSLEYNFFLFPVITLKNLTNEGKEIKRPVKKSHPVCLMRLLTILNIVMVVAALIFFLVCSLQELERCRLGIGVIVVDGIALIWWIVNIIVLTVCRDWIWITYEISIDVELTTYGNSQPRSAPRPLPPHPRVHPDPEVRNAPLNLPPLRNTPRVQTDVETGNCSSPDAASPSPDAASPTHIDVDQTPPEKKKKKKKKKKNNQ